jgi:hypothetical protein
MLNTAKNSNYRAADGRWLPLSVGVAILFVVFAQRSVAADANAVANRIKDLSAPNEMARANACQALGSVDAKHEDVAVDALLGALGDVSGSVRNAAVMALGRIGPGAKKAVPRIIECFQRDTVDKAAVIRTLGCIGPDSPEALDFLIDVVRGGKSGAIRPLDGRRPPMALRQEAIVTLDKVGPKSNKCVPVLVDIVNVAAVDVTRYEQAFRVTVEALSVIGAGDKRVMSTLKRFQQGKGLRAKSKDSGALRRAIIVADSAVKRLERAEEAAAAAAAEQEKGKQRSRETRKEHK